MKAVLMRRAALTGAASLAISLAVAAPPSAASLPTGFSVEETNPSLVGQWSAPFDMGGVAIHATLMHNGEVLFFQYVEGEPGVDHTSYSATWDYRTGITREAPLTYERDVFCAATNVLPDGRAYIAGGHDHDTGKRTDGVGVAETDTFDPLTRTWSPGPLLTQKRWYPTSVGLPSGKTLIFGGQAQTGLKSQTVDKYNPATNTMRRLPATATKPLGNYPRMHVMANGKLLRTSPQKQTVSFKPATSSWSAVGASLFGTRGRGNSVLLPGANEVMVVGGQSSRTDLPTGTAEILDFSAAAPKWRSTGSLNYPRLLGNTVNLPDGQVLIVGGGEKAAFTNPVKIPEIYNPSTEKWTALAPQQASRMYHSTALLLPDGRVLSAGNTNGPMARYAEVFSPPYLFKGARPTITAAPSAASYNQPLTIDTPDAADIASVTLIKAGSVTHQIDTDQRAIPLSFTAAEGTLTAQAPIDADLAPPGYYMLFIVNSNGVPSIAPWIHVG